MGMFGHQAKPTFWDAGRENKWPKDIVGWIFLGRAIRQIGKALYPDEWKGSEPGIDLLAIAARPPSLAASCATSPNLGASLGGGVIEYMRRTAPYQGDVKRREDVYESLTVYLQAGGLRSATRHDPTGEMLPCPPFWWNADHLEGRFCDCRLDRRHPMGGVMAIDHQWIFVSAVGLDKIIGLIGSNEDQEVFTFEEASEENVPASFGDHPPRLKIDEMRRVAAALEEQGIVKRKLTKDDVDREWDTAYGIAPYKKEIEALMKDGRAGRRPSK
ncbi:MAG TPA: hypothetical protein VF649_13785 [Sphingomonas sp.]|jgi:hypothetical protein|uniref:hypothetical protein n=1 Tax=Sphingomonas sp. TaxID=28214 RepID=UPI002ED99A2B